MNDVLTAILKVAKINTSSAEPVFCNRQRVLYSSFRTAFERVGATVELEDCVFHDLQHTFTNRLVMAGVDRQKALKEKVPVMFITGTEAGL